MPDLTTNMQLKKPLSTETVNIGDLNWNMDKLDSHRHSGGSDGQPVEAVQRSNLLVNGGFEIWQRGTGPFTTSGAFTADRWRVDVTGGSTFSVSRIASTIGSKGYSAQLTYTHSPGGAADFLQSMEDVTQLRGRTLSVSAKTKCSVAGTVRLRLADSAGDSQSPLNVGTGEETLTVTRQISAGTTYVWVYVWWDVASSVVEINDILLVSGSVSADYVPLHPAEEWARCQRYYEVHPGLYFAMYTDGGVQPSQRIVWSTRKAATPTVTVTPNAGNTPTAGDSNAMGTTINLGGSGGGIRYTNCSLVAEANP